MIGAKDPRLLMEEKYNCKIQEAEIGRVLGRTFDVEINFLYTPDLGDIARLISLEFDDPEFLVCYNAIYLSEKTLEELLDETSALWG